jgi:hypothetical protein
MAVVDHRSHVCIYFSLRATSNEQVEVNGKILLNPLNTGVDNGAAIRVMYLLAGSLLTVKAV